MLHHLRSIALGATLGALAIAGPVVASPDDPDSLRTELDDVKRVLDDVVRQNHELQTRLSQLEPDAWVNEERAAELRRLVTDIVSDADLRAAHRADGLTAGWDDHFFLGSPDGRFLLELSGQMQLRFVFNRIEQPDRYRYGFENTRTHLIFRGHVFNPELTYKIEGAFDRLNTGDPRNSGGTNGQSSDSGGELRLNEAWIRYQLTNEWSLRAGQFKLPFNREELVPGSRQLTVERSAINESLNVGLSQGVELEYRDSMWAWSLAVSDGGNDQLGNTGSLVRTTPQNTGALSPDSEYSATTRVEFLAAGSWRQFEDFTSPLGEEFGLLVGAGLHVQETEYGNVAGIRDEARWQAYTIDASAEWGGASLFASAFYEVADTASLGQIQFFGATIQGGLYIAPKVELYARYEWGTIDQRGVDYPVYGLATLGANYYIDGHDLKLSADVLVALTSVHFLWDSEIAGTRPDNRGDEPQVAFRLQFQLLF
ncbi:MAG: hypothetical protein KDA25_09250 [Phycisphaerales bacterium]|nr:hypothetical protein [Phycisphaerales bacterium]